MTIISTVSNPASSSTSLAEFETLTVTASGGILSDSSLWVFAPRSNTINVFGQLVAGADLYVEMLFASSLFVGRDATISGAGQYIVMGGFIGSDPTGGGNRLTNHGTIVASGGLVSMTGGDNSVVNYGTMVGGTGGILAGQFGPRDSVTNHGTITVLGSTASPNSGHGVVFDAVDHVLLNTGTIEVFGTGKSGVIVNQIDGTADIRNSGLIISQDGAAVASVPGITFTGRVMLENSGTLARGTDGVAVALGGSADLLINTGRILGDVDTGQGEDTLDLRGGSVTGTVSGGAGNDVYLLSDATHHLIELGGQGVDRVEATVSFALGAEFENLTLLGTGNITGIGNQLANQITGNAGDNRLVGGFGNDNLLGGEGSDLLRGGRGLDRLTGAAGEDTLTGGDGNDTLDGGDDDDRLIGGLGRDVLTGGLDDDSFVFTRLSDTGNTAATADEVTDFSQSRDVIDLRGIDAITTNAAPDNAFVYIGTAAFSNVAGQVRWSITAGVTTIEMDVNGDSLADGMIRLTNGASLTAANFLL